VGVYVVKSAHFGEYIPLLSSDGNSGCCNVVGDLLWTVFSLRKISV
jgi:hypothetical protein